jgi:hypothetical protein
LRCIPWPHDCMIQICLVHYHTSCIYIQYYSLDIRTVLTAVLLGSETLRTPYLAILKACRTYFAFTYQQSIFAAI